MTKDKRLVKSKRKHENGSEMWYGCLDRVANLVSMMMVVNSGSTSHTVISQGYGSVIALRCNVLRASI
jgi:hypothetical protein